MGTVTSLDTGESWEVPDCDCDKQFRGALKGDEEAACEHGWLYTHITYPPYGRVLVWRRRAP